MSLPLEQSDYIKLDDVFRDRRALKNTYLNCLYEILKNNPKDTSREILQRAEKEYGKCPVTKRHFNRIRKEMGFSIGKGRPRGKKENIGETGQTINLNPNASFLGTLFLNDWIDQNRKLAIPIQLLSEGIEAYIDENPDKSFPLLNHREETLIGRFKAILYAPIFSIKKLSEYDVKEHGLSSVLGRSYQSSTLNQHLGSLERIDAGDILIPALLPEDPGAILYIDGHMTPFWSSKSMHKGKITMLGRIMAGSQAVVAHNEAGRPLFFEYYPPDFHLNRVILDYCKRLIETTNIRVFVIDREVNSLKIAQEFTSEGIGLLTMLDSNQYKSLSDWDVELISEEGVQPKIYKGTWKELDKEDPRLFVILEKEDRLLVYWGTPIVETVIDPIHWPEVYSSRTEIQENSFKRMKDHGALDVNYGIKKIEVTDRHKERELNALKEKLDKATVKTKKKALELAKQEQKVEESVRKCHKKLLNTRLNGLELKKKPSKKPNKKKRK